MDILPPMDCTAGKPAPSIWYQSYLVGSRLYLQSECRIMLYLSAFQHFSIFSTSRSALSSVQVECHGCRHCVKPTPGWWIQPAFCWDGQAADHVLGHPIFIQPPPHLSGAAAPEKFVKLGDPGTPSLLPPLRLFISLFSRFISLCISLCSSRAFSFPQQSVQVECHGCRHWLVDTTSFLLAWAGS